jgi:hypothetical protein
MCKQCKSEYDIVYRNENKELIINYGKKRYSENRTTINQHRKQLYYTRLDVGYTNGTLDPKSTTGQGIITEYIVSKILNCKRLNKNTPCSKDGVCSECDLKETICKATLILHHPTGNNVVHIIIINETLGY